MATYHPQLDDHRRPVRLISPSTPTPLSSWQDYTAVATVIPNGVVPEELNGIALANWDDVPRSVLAWNAVEGQLDFDEPPFHPSKSKMPAAGVAIVENDGRIWLVTPSNGYGGYANTFPKGRINHGVNLQPSAIREAWEEAGLKIKITGFLADSNRTQSYTRYYLAKRMGGNPAAMGWESQAVHLVPPSQLPRFLTHPNDLPLLSTLLALTRADIKADILEVGGDGDI